MQDLKCTGRWWIPPLNSHTVGGTLTYSPRNGVVLDLLGSFRNLSAGAIHLGGSFTNYPMIHGATAEGKHVTLVSCESIGLTISGIIIERIHAAWAFVGDALCTTAEFSFSEMRFELSRLSDWLSITGFKERHEPADGQVGQDYELRYRSPDNLTATVKGTVIERYIGFSRKGDPRTAIQLSQTTRLIVKPQSPGTLPELIQQYLTPLANLVTLATDRANELRNLEVRSMSAGLDLPNGKRTYPLLKVLYAIHQPQDDGERRLLPNEMLFTLGEFSGGFANVVERWFASMESLDSVCDLYFGTLFNQDMHIGTQFLNRVQAVEAYHRIRLGGRRIDPGEYEQMRKELIEHLTGERRALLSDIMAFGNELPLRQRLEQMYDASVEIIEPLGINRDEFVRRVKNTRHYLTHLDPRGREKAVLAAEGQYRLARILDYMLKAFLMNELGIAWSALAGLFNRNSAYVFFKNQRE